MSVKLLTEHPLELLNLIGGCTGSSESTLVKMPHCWKSHVVAHILLLLCSCARAIEGNMAFLVCFKSSKYSIVNPFKPN